MYRESLLSRPSASSYATFRLVFIAGLVIVSVVSFSQIISVTREWKNAGGNALRSPADGETEFFNRGGNVLEQPAETKAFEPPSQTEPPPQTEPPQTSNDPPTQTLREFYSQHASTLTRDQQKIVDMMKHAWSAYDKYGQHLDMLDVVHQKGTTFMGHDMAFTLVDSLDTLFVMGLHDEFDQASAWMKTNLEARMIQPGSLSFFETTIRSLGGLLSAYYLSGETHILELSDVLAKALAKAFTRESPIPRQWIDLKTGSGYGSPCLSEGSSFQLEFSYLAHATGKAEYSGYVKGVNNHIARMTRDFYTDGLVPLQPQWSSKQGYNGDKSFGALGDSHFEYLLKQWLLTGKQDDEMKQRYLQAIDGMNEKLIGHTTPSNLTFLGALRRNGKLERTMEHLTCFTPGMLALGAYHGLPQWHLDLAKALMETCAQMYMRSSTKLSPENVHFAVPSKSTTKEEELFVTPSDDYNIQRPETVESLMILWRVTKDEKYREYGRTIADAFETHAKVAGGGYRDMQNVFKGPIKTKGNVMETFFLAETLKYLFLLFSDDKILSLDEIVFNTEAHPLPVLVN